jgi:hypothetical protein
VDKETISDITRKVAMSGIIAILAATVRALLVKTESLNQTLRTFGAGVLMGILLGIILRNYSNEFAKEIIISSSSAFISTIWPILERATKRIVSKKVDNVANTNLD